MLILVFAMITLMTEKHSIHLIRHNFYESPNVGHVSYFFAITDGVEYSCIQIIFIVNCFLVINPRKRDFCLRGEDIFSSVSIVPDCFLKVYQIDF